MKKSRPDILTKPLFILALGILLLNDFYLKYEYSNVLTGKLSDFAGLFLFPYLLSSLRINWTKTIYIATAFLFIFWKSEFSQSILFWIQLNGIGMSRVVDYSDIIALTIMPFSFIYFQKQLEAELRIHKALMIPILFIGLFAIWATTLPREQVTVNVYSGRTFELETSKTEFFNSLTAGHPYSDVLEKNVTDSLFYLMYDMYSFKADVTVLASITAVESNKTVVKLDSVLYGYITGGLFTGVDRGDVEEFSSLTAEEFEYYFERNFIEPIKNQKTLYLYYDNKEIRDFYEKE
jgi:hypothetical protein